MMLNAVSNLFDYLLLIETTWLDLPVSIQNCALTGLQSALFLTVAFVYEL